MKTLWQLYKSNYNHICIVDSAYSLLVYIIKIDPKLEKTAFILGPSIHPTIKAHLPLCLSLKKSPKKNIYKRICYTIWYYFFLSPIIKFCLKKERSYYGYDHIYFSNLLGKKYNVIEDGLLNYDPQFHSVGSLFNILTGIDKIMGYSDRAENIYLSGIQEIPSPLTHKVIKFDLYSSWNKLTSVEKNNILKIFGMPQQNQLSISTLLLTQPLSEDGLISDSDKNEIYKNLLIEMGVKKVTVKIHPRETTGQYDFGDIEINYINQFVPIELLSFTGLRVDQAITLYSSAIFSLNAAKKLIYGTEKLIGIYKKLPLIVKQEIK